MVLTVPVRRVLLASLAVAGLLMTSCSDAVPEGASPSATQRDSSAETVGTTTEAEMTTGPDDTGHTTETATGRTTAGSTGSAPTSGATETQSSAVPPGADPGQSATTPPPVGIPGGVPGAPPLSEQTVHALTAVVTAEAETGGRPYGLTRGPSHWVVMVRLWDGGREVRVDDDGTGVESVTSVDVDEEVALMLDTVVVPMVEAAEVAVADRPGDIAAVAAVESDGAWTWQVSVDTGSGLVQVPVDVGSGVVTGPSRR